MTLNIKNLVRLRDVILADLDTRLDMSSILPEASHENSIVSINECGTVGCIAGFAIIHFRDEMKPNDTLWNAAESWLGMNYEQSLRLFGGLFSTKKLDHIDRQDALTELNRLIHKHWFDKAYAGLQAQGWERSTRESNNSCVYRSPEGKNCAVGKMLEEGEYLPAMDGQAWSHADFTAAGLLPGLTEDQFDAIQKLHDVNRDPEDMQAAFDAYAQRHNLS